MRSAQWQRFFSISTSQALPNALGVILEIRTFHVYLHHGLRHISIGKYLQRQKVRYLRAQHPGAALKRRLN